MNKILASLFLLISSVGQAQLLSENFSTGTLPFGFANNYQENDGNPWEFSSGKAIITNSTGVLGNGGGPSWLISKTFIPQVGFATLVFDYQESDPSLLGTTDFKVLISNSGGFVISSYQTLLIRSRGEGSSAEIRLDIPQEYWGTSCKVAFTMQVGGVLAQDTRLIDNIRLESEILYAVRSGNLDEALYSLTPGGVSSIIPGTNSRIVVPANITISANRDFTLAGLMIMPGGTFQLQNKILTILGDNCENRGTALMRSGKIVFAGKYPQRVLGTLVSGNVEIDNSSVLNLEGVFNVFGNIKVRGKINTNGFLTLGSDNNSTGSIGALLNSGDVSGKVTVNRFFPAIPSDWRFLSSAVSNVTLQDWNDDFVTSGFPGSDSPNSAFRSMFAYKEPTSGPTESGLFPPKDILDPLTPGAGFYIFGGDSLQSGSSFILDLFGDINKGSITRELSFTNTGNPVADGFQMAGNPYPSPILFSQVQKTLSQNKYWFYDPNTGTNEMWNGNAGIGLISNTGIIPAGQAFWIKAENTGAELGFSELSKTSIDSLYLLNSTLRFLRFKIASTSSRFTDRLVVNINDASTNGFDSFDNEKMPLNNADSPMILTNNGRESGIDSRPSFQIGDSIPLILKTGKTGSFLLSLENIQNMDGAYTVLYNRENGNRVVVDTSLRINVSLTKGTDNRNLVLVKEKFAEISSQDVECFDLREGKINAKGQGTGPWDYIYKDISGNILRQRLNSFGPDSLDQLGGGQYIVQIISRYLPMASDTVKIIEPKEILVDISIQNESCPEDDNGFITVSSPNQSATFYSLSTGASGTSFGPLESGIYTLFAYDGNNCEKAYSNIVIKEPDTLRVSIDLHKDSVAVGSPISFTANSNGDNTFYSWNFGDGNLANGRTVSNVYQIAGLYTVSVKAADEECQAQNSRVLKVFQPSTVGFEEFSKEITIRLKDNLIYLVSSVSDLGQIEISAMDGKVIYGKDIAFIKGEETLFASTLPTGVYVLSIRVGEKAYNRKIFIR